MCSPIKSTISRTLLATVLVQPILCASTVGSAGLIPGQSTPVFLPGERIPGMEEPGRLPSMRSHRVGHD